ncbi:hypothetical protein ABH931_007954 [Streptacidiphilus sp. MAP12-33]|uniref:type ISP restriction/modification enzyme n=1 Tax=Streptacidiphilus sp. MAP12-33 TaxID=3156266 RepID=UPI003513D3AE
MADTGGQEALPSLGDLLPWSVRGIRTGRAWVVCADPEVLEERWRRLVAAPPGERSALFEPSRARTPDSAVAGLPGQRGSTRRLSREPGTQPPLVRVRTRPLDRAWMLADQRLLDQARPELWRAEGAHQRYLLVHPDGAPPTVSAELPVDPRMRVHPLHRRPDGREPNLAPGLLRFLRRAYAAPVTAESVLAWIAAVAVHGDDTVPLPRSAATWAEGVALGRRVVDLHTFAQGGGLRLPDGRRTFVRHPVDAQPQELGYDPEEETLLLGDGRLAPVPPQAWAAPAEATLREWFADRCAFRGAARGTLAALGLTVWPQRATTELVELATTLARLGELLPARHDLAADGGPWFTHADLHEAAILPVPASAQRPASVLDRLEEGPEGQYALL